MSDMGETGECDILKIMAKHFFKVLAIFLAMIIFGLIGVFVVNYLDEKTEQAPDVNNQTQIAK